ncbi:MAG: hypothetical protein LBH92_05910 [Bacteroidales bacterium]|jgi:opacity protein-like surface antigen|nr:hypothetical protein [Bacteroidales bacterium]
MKKCHLLFAGLFLFSMMAANGQEIFSKGSQLISLGIGVGAGIPVELSYERSIVDGLIKKKNGAIGVGAYGGWYHRKLYDWNYNYYVLGARGAFHYQFVKKLDTYGGLMLGYSIATASWAGDGESVGTPSGSAFSYSLYIGARYLFKPRLGVYAEAGYGISYLSAGITFKL